MNRGSGARIHLQLLYKCEPADLYHLYSVGTLGKIIEKGVKISPRRSWWSRLGLGQKLLKEAGLWWQIIGLKFCGLGVHIALGARLFYAKNLLDCSAHDEILSEHEFYISEISKGFFSVKNSS